jgi:hypothetical protein
MSKGKMHELLAVESTIAGNYNRDMVETQKAFSKPELFTKLVKVVKHFEEAMSHLDTVETVDMATTVKDRLEWFGAIAAKYLDVQLQKDKTNQSAKADLIVEGTVIATAVPATTLLMLETKLQDIRKVIEQAPTLPAGIEWLPATSEAPGRYVNKDDAKTFKTSKKTQAVVLYEATKEHPAQVKEVTVDHPVAEILAKRFSGATTAADKAAKLGRLDSLLQAAKTARQKANTAEADASKFGDDIVSFILG